jgi:putative transcriptional regulator
VRTSKTRRNKNMFNENLKTIRKAKGYTQEELAIKINVVRQTISKWEKGLSVPDADVLTQIADVLEVSVSELLGADIKEGENKNEIAEQLAKVCEQLAQKNRRSKKIWKIIGIILMIGIILSIVCFGLFTNVHSSAPTNTVEVEDMEE